MTPQEQELVDDLFDRLTRLESAPRDPEAERLIAAGLQRAPHAVYALVQTALVQDEALKRANARIEDLQAQMSADDEGATAAPQRPASFLDSMREAFTGRAPARGSVPNVRPSAPGDAPQSNQPRGYPPPPAYSPQPAAPPYPAGPAVGTGGSFLGSVASTSAGVIGGSLLLDGIRSMFGHHAGTAPSAFGGVAGDHPAPWSGAASAVDSKLARDAGIDHVGQPAGRDDGTHPLAAADDPTQNGNDEAIDNVADDSDFDDDNSEDNSDDNDFDGADDDDSYDA